jgi:predicted transcriptional regulator
MAAGAARRPPPKQTAFWLRGDLAERLDDLVRTRKRADQRPRTVREALNAAVERYLDAEAAGAGPTRPA